MLLRVISFAALALATLVAPAGGEESKAPAAAEVFDITVGGSLMSDYIYGGISLSARRPAVASSIDVQRGWFYVSGEARSVSLPTNPAAELALTGGIRRTLVDIEFDLPATYFYYPGETLTETDRATDYWQADISASRRFADRFTVVGRASYSPNISHTGAWGSYLAGEFRIDLPKLTPAQGNELGWLLAAELGHADFGNTTLGDYALPSYTHWRLGLTFSYDALSFDLSYHDTSLSKENCFVHTGDPAAAPGGIVSLSNPDGLRSRLCGQALVGTLSFEFTASKAK